MANIRKARSVKRGGGYLIPKIKAKKGKVKK